MYFSRLYLYYYKDYPKMDIKKMLIPYTILKSTKSNFPILVFCYVYAFANTNITIFFCFYIIFTEVSTKN